MKLNLDEPEATAPLRAFTMLTTFDTFRMLCRFRFFALLVVAAALGLGACRQQMAEQPYREPLEPSEFFADGMASRQPPPGTVARGSAQLEPRLTTGRVDGKAVDGLPFAITREVLERGRERYEIFCTPCHDRIGSGQGMIVRRGFQRARSFHESRLRQEADGYFFEVISRGAGAMPSYAHQLTPHERWAIVAYIRALQLSRNVPATELPDEDREKLKGLP